jgi:hypothetical protein
MFGNFNDIFFMAGTTSTHALPIWKAVSCKLAEGTPMSAGPVNAFIMVCLIFDATSSKSLHSLIATGKYTHVASTDVASKRSFVSGNTVNLSRPFYIFRTHFVPTTLGLDNADSIIISLYNDYFKKNNVIMTSFDMNQLLKKKWKFSVKKNYLQCSSANSWITAIDQNREFFREGREGNMVSREFSLPDTFPYHISSYY